MRKCSFAHLVNWVERFPLPETVILGGLAILVGLSAAAGVWLFKRLIELAQAFFFTELAGWLAPLGRWTVVLFPLIGGLLVGLIVHFLIKPERHHGVAGIIESVALGGGRLPYRSIPAKTAAAVLSIGSGASVGPEDPSVQIGANLGSLFGQVTKLSEERVRTLVAAGSAAGIAAAFNAPIAGVFFALEIILGEIATPSLGMLLLASVVSAVFTQAVSGAEPAFHVPAYAFHSAWELLFYLVLGLCAGLISALYIRLLFLSQDLFHAWRFPNWLKPMLAGLLVGALGIFLPQIFGVGYASIEAVLQRSNTVLWLLLALMAAKLVLTPVSIGGGFVGGVFAPSLFMGAMLGGAFGVAANTLFPTLEIVPAAFAMVGMAAVLAGAIHAPLTAILLLFEMTNDYRIILPLMFAVVIASLVSRLIQKDSVYIHSLARKGVRIQRGRDVEVLDGIRVEEVMQTDYPTLREDESLLSAAKRMVRMDTYGLPVLTSKGELCGILTLQDINRTGEHFGGAARTVGAVCNRSLHVAFPDESLGVVLHRMSIHDVGRLPVVSRQDARRLLGIIRRSDAVRAYDMALRRNTELRHRAGQVRLGLISGAQVEEVRIEQGAACDGRMVQEIPWPKESVIASLRRGRRLLIPRGNTTLYAGDVLAFVAEGEARQKVRALCQQPLKSDGEERTT